MQTPRVEVLSAVLAFTALLTACGASPTAPSPTIAITVTRVDILGPDAVAPGSAARFTAMASFSDGSTRDVTHEAQWSTLGVEEDQLAPTLLNFSSPGLWWTTQHLRGAAWLGASYRSSNPTEGSFGEKCVWVLPAGTYYIFGNVTDRGVEIRGAGVELVGDPAAFGYYTCGWNGRPYPARHSSYELFGVPNVAQIRVTKDGYQPLVQTVQVTRNQQRIDFELTALPVK